MSNDSPQLIAPPEQGTAKLLNVSPREYHTDPMLTPSLSASTAKIIIGDCPRRAWKYHPRLGKVRKIPTSDMEFGTVCHGLLHECMADVVIIEANDYRKDY